MIYLCLRDCYCYDRFHYKGRKYEFSDNRVISEKNFKPTGLEATESTAQDADNTLILFQCPLCGIGCNTEQEVTEHIKEAHKEVKFNEDTTASDEAVQGDDNGSQEEPEGFECDVCHKICKTESGLYTHKKAHERKNKVNGQ